MTTEQITARLKALASQPRVVIADLDGIPHIHRYASVTCEMPFIPAGVTSWNEDPSVEYVAPLETVKILQVNMWSNGHACVDMTRLSPDRYGYKFLRVDCTPYETEVSIQVECTEPIEKD